MSQYIVYYDGACAFCAANMAKLRHWDKLGALAFVDIAAPGFDPASTGASMDALNRELHVLSPDGALASGTAAIVAIYRATGQGWRAWPLMLPLAGPAYRLFARHRYRVSRWLGLRVPACQDGLCALKGRP